jgi:hypothetical protein
MYEGEEKVPDGFMAKNAARQNINKFPAISQHESCRIRRKA